ncbi:MAG: ABC transporter ATP-binding protein [Candidatus Babeliaceae bacterium]|jgi:spermidine/putrescine transport system ATP-binding protein
MRSIRLENISKKYNGELILENINLTIPTGKFFALLGPSGSGKTTLLRLIGGFERVDSGSIFLGKQDITHKPINQRHINTVFQSYALFPHLNVFDNVAYSLKIKHMSAAVVKEKVLKVLKTVHLGAHAYKSIQQLSGGQQQRVALARAIINEPDVLLLDEPLAALDFKLREKVLVELIELQDKLKTTFIYVTHDQFEALTVADQMAIMNHHGEIEQIGTPKEIYEFPVSSFVAQFVGTTNIIPGVLRLNDHNEWSMVCGSLGAFSVYIPKVRDWMHSGARVVMSIRPEKIFISKSQLAGFSNVSTGTVEAIIYHGRSTQYNVRLKDDTRLQVFSQNEEHFPQEIIDYDNEVFLYWQKENVVVLER